MEQKYTENNITGNPLGEESIGRLLKKFAIPSIVAMLVSALYNIVDQFFIGRNVGELGNAATNISFPFSSSCLAIALLFGIGGASAFNLSLGKGEKEKAYYYMGNALVTMFSLGVVLCIVVQLGLEPILRFFGSSDNVIGYAKEYTRITSLGFPFLILSSGGGHLVRANGSPKITMFCNIVGAAINTVLDYFFVSVFKWEMAGAAWATIIGQFFASAIVVVYFIHGRKRKSCEATPKEKLTFKNLVPKGRYISRVASLGIAPCSNQLSMMIVQIVMNKSLKYYGGISSYGEDIPIACVGIISKVNMLFFSFVIGISQGLQPIVSFNYGARKYKRVKKSYITAVSIAFALASVAFVLFQTIPRQIIALFGGGSEDYFTFAIRYFRVFLFFTFLNCLQPITSNFFTAIGKPIKGVFLSLTRQIIFFIPLVLILPVFLEMDGILYAGPTADLIAAVTAFLMMRYEFKKDIYK